MENIKTWRQYCIQKILKRMRGDRFGALFAHPVLETSDSVIPPAVKESYRATIPKPMDYSTVKSNIDKGVYQTPEEFHEDMLLIYDNCMKFNPSTGVNNWIYNAGLSNKAKYIKIWESSQNKLNKLIAKELGIVPQVSGSFETDTSSVIFTNADSLESEASVATSSHAESAPPPPQPSEEPAEPASPVFKFSFRISLSKINEYKTKLAQQAALAAQQEGLAALPPTPFTEPEAEPELEPELEPGSVPITEPAEQYAHEEEIIAIEDYKIQDTASEFELPLSLLDEPMEITEHMSYDAIIPLPQSEAEEEQALEELNIDIPPILSRLEDGILRVNWLTDNGCHELFPDCTVLGPHPIKPEYNANDISLRRIYNDIYLSEKSSSNESTKREHPDLALTEDYTMKQHKMISFLLSKPKHCSKVTPTILKEFLDADRVSVTDEEASLPSTIDTDSYDCSSGNTPQSDSADCSDQSTPVRTQTLNIRLRSHATVGVDNESDRILLKNGFIRARSKNCKVNCPHKLSFTIEYKGYYRADESFFTYRSVQMRHLRLFLVNCGTVEVELFKRCLPLVDFILSHGTESHMYDLFMDSKRNNPRNIAFFQLPNSGKVSYSRSMDVMWRLQTVTNALPTPFMVLHIVYRDI